MNIKSFFSWLNIIPLSISVGLFIYSQYSTNIHLATPIFIFVIYLTFLLIFLKHSAYVINPCFKKLINRIEQYMFRNSYSYNGNNKAIGNLDKFIEDEYEEFRNDSIAKLAPSVFPILGIFFTFASIALFMPDFSSQNADGLNNEITELLQGVGTAFYASMYGLFMLLWWQYFEQRGMDKILESLLKVKDQYDIKFWTNEEIQLIRLLQQKGLENSFAKSIKSALSPEFVNQLNDKLTNQLENLSRIISTETDIHKNLLEQFDKFTIFQDKLMDRQEKLVETHDGLLKNNEDLIEKQQDGLIYFEEINKTIYENLSKLFSSLDKSINHLEVFSSKSSSLIESFNLVEKSIKESGSNIESVVSLTENLKQLIGKINIANENYDSIITKLNDSFKEIVSQNEQIKEVFGDKIDVLNTNTVNLIEYSKSLSISFEKFDLEKFNVNLEAVNRNVDSTAIFTERLEKLADNMEQANENYDSIITKLNESFKEILSQNDKVQDIFGDKVDMINKNSSSILEYTKTLNSTMSKMDFDKFTSNIISVNQSIKDIKSTFSKTSTELKDSIELFNDNIADKIREVFKTIDIENSQVLDRLLSGFKDVQKYNAKFEDSVDTLTTEFALLNEQLALLNDKKNESN